MSDASDGARQDEAVDAAHHPPVLPEGAGAEKLADRAQDAQERVVSFPQAVPTTQPEQPGAVAALCRPAGDPFGERSCAARVLSEQSIPAVRAAAAPADAVQPARAAA